MQDIFLEAEDLNFLIGECFKHGFLQTNHLLSLSLPFLYMSLFLKMPSSSVVFYSTFWNVCFRWDRESLTESFISLAWWWYSNLKQPKILFCHFQKNNLHLHCTTYQCIKTIHFIVWRNMSESTTWNIQV